MADTKNEFYRSLSYAQRRRMEKYCVLWGISHCMGQEMPGLDLQPTTSGGTYVGPYMEAQVKKEKARRQYRWGNFITIVLLILQIIVALLVTTLSAYGHYQGSVTIFGSVNVAFAALLAVLKGMKWTEKKGIEMNLNRDLISSIEKGVRAIASDAADGHDNETAVEKVNSGTQPIHVARTRDAKTTKSNASRETGLPLPAPVSYLLHPGDERDDQDNETALEAEDRKSQPVLAELFHRHKAKGPGDSWKT